MLRIEGSMKALKKCRELRIITSQDFRSARGQILSGLATEELKVVSFMNKRFGVRSQRMYFTNYHGDLDWVIVTHIDMTIHGDEDKPPVNYQVFPGTKCPSACPMGPNCGSMRSGCYFK